MLDIHIGVRAEDLEAFERIVERELDGIEVATNNESWNFWEPFKGEPFKGEQKETDVLHVYITTQTPMVTLNYLISRLAVFLNPLDDQDSAFNGRWIIVTDHEHWNQYYVELSYPE